MKSFAVAVALENIFFFFKLLPHLVEKMPGGMLRVAAGSRNDFVNRSLGVV